MNELYVILFFILLTDMINPVLFAGLIYSLGSSHPIRNTLALLASYFLSYFLSGVVILIGLEAFEDWLHIPDSFDYVIEFIVALLLLYVGVTHYRSGDTHPERALKKDPRMSLGGAWWMGISVNFIGLPLAMPYLAAIDQILKANLSYVRALAILLGYNTLYILPFAAMIALRWIFHQETHSVLLTINRWLHRISERYIPVLFTLLGLVLLEDCISFFLGYREYSLLSLSRS